MATPSHGSTSTSSANFDMRQSEEMWKSFNRMFKWGIILSIIVLTGMATFLTGHHAPLP
jgi:hypothetical protein